jgi:Rrf2 family protein
MITKTLEYAVRAVQFLNQSEDRVWCRKEISRALDIPDKYAGVVLNKLCVGGLIESRCGAEGGYLRTPAGQDATLGDVLSCVEGFPTGELSRVVLDQLGRVRIDSIHLANGYHNRLK